MSNGHPYLVTAPVAAELLGVSRPRIGQLLRAGRVEGAYQVGNKTRRLWFIPLGVDGKPHILPGKTAGKGRPRLHPEPTA